MFLHLRTLLYPICSPHFIWPMVAALEVNCKILLPVTLPPSLSVYGHHTILPLVNKAKSLQLHWRGVHIWYLLPAKAPIEIKQLQTIVCLYVWPNTTAFGHVCNSVVTWKSDGCWSQLFRSKHGLCFKAPVWGTAVKKGLHVLITWINCLSHRSNCRYCVPIFLKGAHIKLYKFPFIFISESVPYIK